MSAREQVDRPSALATPERPWLLDADQVIADLASDRARGLSSEDAAARLEQFGPNELESALAVPAWRRLLDQFIDPLVLLLIVAVVISLVVWVIGGAVGIPYEAIVIAAILTANALLGFVQEARAEQAVAALQQMAAPTVRVVRDGEEQTAPAADLVPGDIIVLGEGDSVAADARLIEAYSLSIAEASLTGESEPVLKNPDTLAGTLALGDRTSMAFSGTAVIRGRGRAVVTATGMATEMGRIAELLGETKEEATPLQREIGNVGRVLGIAVVVIAAVVVGSILLVSDLREPEDFVDVLLIGVSLAVAAVPEGLPAVLSVVLAIGVQRMARQNAIVKSLSSVETLGSASVVCSDKTGTLTRNEMTLQRIVTNAGSVEVSGIGYQPEGELLSDGRPVEDGPLLAEVRMVLSGGSLANDSQLREEDGEWVAQGDPTEVAFLVAERKAGFAEERVERFRRVGEIPFSSDRKMMSTVEADAERDDLVEVVAKGAPDVLLARCTAEQVGDDPRPLTDERRREILETVDGLANDALRTLAVAHRPLDSAPPEVDETVEQDLTFVGVVGIIDPPRDEARSAIAEAHRAGIRVVMITGDHPKTGGRIAQDLGITDDAASVVTGNDIDAMDEATFRKTVREASVYARVAPEHKLRIVDVLQDDGNIVAMTGDGVNDAPALKAADIGVAMGITGTDVTKEAANMILADDNFATIIAAVREGRAIFSNIRKFLRYLLSSNAGEVLTMLLGVLGAGLIGLDEAGDVIAVPLLATQILWINLLTDAAPALALGVDPPQDDVMERSPRRLSDRVIGGPMMLSIGFIGLVMAVVTLAALDLKLPGGFFDGSGDLTEARTMAFTTLVLAQLYNCFNARSSRISAFHQLFSNRLLWGAVVLSLLLQVAVVHLPFLNEAFDTAPLSVADWLVCAALASVVLWASELVKVVRRRMGSAR